ncbi:glutamyl-tRNA reductase [Halosimplex carlsbadense 2-9-1]|uniref:Glutamyl-tRNA reductase n=1 Tax=Halosimplex carlsbadense 2-9-1 TaxID=797114 RepID=M0CLA3_9EURY|nr:glutamyl-tRNA reductase [Halosimplex carlsbadense]ELZ22664.1 glutamyl-tRNA reductase [Halosimplex carlsbadense 2-9-1]
MESCASGASEDADRSDSGAEDADEALAAIHERGAEIRDREVETALAKLDARGDCSAAERAAVERLADRLVARLLSSPERSLRAAADDGEHDPETVETALSLFGD